MGAKFEDSKKYDLNKRKLIQNTKATIEMSQFEIENGIIHEKSKLTRLF
ncbi:hypothetical protein [uncultured Aquimarina sp.]|nr:hypothetical protein [uncultured Aquimarina sp.]